MSIVYSSNNLAEIWRQVRLVVLPRLGVHEAEVPCWTILFLNNRRLQKLLTVQKENKLKKEPNIWIYPEEAPISQGGEGINFFTFFGIVIAINSLWIKFSPSLSPPSQRQSFQAVCQEILSRRNWQLLHICCLLVLRPQSVYVHM